MPKTSSRQSRYARYFIGTALVGTSLSQIALPVLADLLAAGEPISNTATATYQVVGPSGTTTITTESNTVTVTVAEIAGVTVTPSGLNNATNPGQSFQPGNQAEYIFDVENTGNDPTKFFLPTAASLNSAGAIQIDDDGTGPGGFTGGGGSALTVTYQVYENGVLVGTLTPTEINVDDLAGGSDRAETISVAPGQVVKVSILVQLDAGLADDDQIRVVFGNTNTQEATAGGDNLQNQQRGISDGAVNDVYTSDNPNGSVIGEVNGDPVNGTREAEGQNTLTINANTLKPFVKIEKDTGTFTDDGNANGLEGDSLEYSLAVSVANSLTEVGVNVPPGVTGVDDLKPTAITLDGNPVNRVLVSDVLPFDESGTAQATLSSTSVPTAPSGWTVVYSISDPNTLSGTTALWTTTAPATLSDATQVGFIYSNSIANTTVAGSSLLKGSNVSGFTFEVTFDAAFNGDTTVRNIAEVYGTGGDDLDGDGDGSFPVKDQSGDPTYNNDEDGNGFDDDDNDDDGTLDPGAGSPSDPGGTTNGDDPGGNAGDGSPGGENTVYEKVDSGTIRNGTVAGNTSSGTLQPEAQGPTDINDDFTNVNSPITATTVPAVTFNNSLKNTGADPDRFCLTVDAYNDLPAGTTTITIEQQQASSGSVRVVYTVTKSSATATATVTIANQDGTSNPLYLLIAGTTATPAGSNEQRYTVNVKLPDDAPRVAGYDVPIVAYKDLSNTGTSNLCAQGINDDSVPGPNDPYNITIDRVYTGFVELTKKVQVLDASGNPVSGPRGLMDTNTKSIAPGERMKYLVEYLNISEVLPAASGTQSQNVILNAQNFTIVEDGTASGNNWGLDLDGDNAMDTVHVEDSSLHTPPSGNLADVVDIKFFTTDPSNEAFLESDGQEDDANVGLDAPISKYTTLLAGNLEPQGAGSFTFQREFAPTNP